MVLRFETSHLGRVEQGQLMPRDRLPSPELVVDVEASASDGVLGGADLAHDLNQLEVGEVVDEVLGHLRPVLVEPAAGKQRRSLYL
jgi:hypothetical protein